MHDVRGREKGELFRAYMMCEYVERRYLCDGAKAGGAGFFPVPRIQGAIEGGREGRLCYKAMRDTSTLRYTR